MIKKFLDLGQQPLANSYLKKKNLSKKEKKYRLQVGLNIKKKLVSIIKTVPSGKMFNDNYPYRSSISKTMKKSFENFAKKVKKKFNPKFIIEIGSNDGVFLKYFNKKKIVGIEPCSNLEKLTSKMGYKTYSEFWNKRLAKLIKKKNSTSDLIYSANTISHIKDIDTTLSSINLVLSSDGILILEDPSLLECLKMNAYDQFYCEHIYVFSLISISRIIKKFNLEVFDIEKTKTHGGSNRYYIKRCNNKKYLISTRVKKIVNEEVKFGLNKFSTYLKFANRVNKSRIELLKILKKLKYNNLKVIGYGATAKSVTVLNFCNIKKDLISYFVDTTPDKQNKYIPGVHIPIKKYAGPIDSNIDVIYLGAWNFKKEILIKEKNFSKNGGKFLTHVPYPKII